MSCRLKKVWASLFCCCALVSCSSGGEPSTSGSSASSSDSSSLSSSSVSSTEIYHFEVSGIVNALNFPGLEGYMYRWGEYQMPTGAHKFARYFGDVIAGDVVTIAFSSDDEEGYYDLEEYPPIIQPIGHTTIDEVTVEKSPVFPISVVDGIPQHPEMSFSSMLCPAGYALGENGALIPLSTLESAYATIRMDLYAKFAAAIYAFEPRRNRS